MISVKDIAGLFYVYHAYITINKTLFGNAVLLGFHEGNFGTISRIFNVIERNVADKLKKMIARRHGKYWMILQSHQRKEQRNYLGNSIAQDCLRELKGRCFYGSI